MLDHRSLAGLDFHGHGHAGGEIHGLAFDQHGDALQSRAGRIDRAALLVVDGVVRDMDKARGDRAVTW